MANFRFRAAAALDVRRKEEDAARLQLAKAELAVAAASQRAQEARDRVADEGQRLAGVQHGGVESWRVQWHRAWIDRQRREADARVRDVTLRTGEAAEAAQAAKDAVKRRRVLERLRERALRKHERAVHEQHVKDMNELATLRFVAHIAEEGGTRAD